MRANNPRILIPIAIVLVVLIFAANFLTGGAQYSSNLNDLRAEFNNDRGQVRLLMLLAPS